MRILEQGNYIKVLSDELKPLDFLGCRHQQHKGDPWYIVENNIVNRIVLGLKFDQFWQPVPSLDLQVTEGLAYYQVKDVMHMIGTRNILNANPMGLGKTVETIRYLKALDAKSVLIVCPKIIRTQWVDQIAKWWGRTAYVYENECTPRPGEIWIINYDKLKLSRILPKFKSFQWDVVILDEAHKIKNRTSQNAIACKSLPAARKVALTGTPILRYVDDLWSILHFLDVRYSGNSYWNFVNYFCEKEDTPWGARIVGLTKNPERLAVLNKLMQLVSIRNDAIEVAQGKTCEVVRLPMDKEQRKLYNKERKLLLSELPDNCTIANGAVLTLRLRQTTSWPGMFIQDCVGPKFEWILETCQNNPEEQFVVFSTFSTVVDALHRYLSSNHVLSDKITGSQDAETNEISKRLFIDKKVQVLIGTIGAMGQGYDGLQNVCRLMIFIDLDWSPAIMEQAEDRLHRMGQNNPVTIYYLECTGSFDQYVGRINANKTEDIKEALNNETKSND